MSELEAAVRAAVEKARADWAGDPNATPPVAGARPAFVLTTLLETLEAELAKI